MRLMQFRRGLVPRPESDGVIYGASYAVAPSSRALETLILGTFLFLIVSGLSTLALTSHIKVPTVARPAAVQTASAQGTPTPASTPPSTTPATASAAPTRTSSTPKTPNCSRGSYDLPSTISGDGRAAGVYIQDDPADSYQVFGISNSQINDQMFRCTPVRSGGVFAANTGYNLSDYYSYGVSADGLCRVTKAIVTLHINQVFPAWTNTGAPSSVAANWNRFISSLRAHEQGHVGLDKAYAQKVYDTITATPPQSCSSIQGSVDANVRGVTNSLAAANDSYDTTTKHGTTQGAVL